MVGRLNEAALAPASSGASAHTPASDKAAGFEQALAHASNAAKASVPESAEAGLQLPPQALTAADDAWVEVVAAAEELRDPALSAERRQMLLQSLAANWRSFQSQSEPISRMLESTR